MDEVKRYHFEGEFIAFIREQDYLALQKRCEETCDWVYVIPDGISSWYESSCGLIGDGPHESWKFCPECGKKINLTVEEQS